MTMSQAGPTAADFLNGAPEAEIADVLFRYRRGAAEPPRRPRDRRRPAALDHRRARQVVRKALGYRQGAPKDRATRSFQAIRIHVNGELDELEPGSARRALLRRAAARRRQLPQPRGPDCEAVPTRGRRGQIPGPRATSRSRPRGPAATFEKLSKAIRAVRRRDAAQSARTARPPCAPRFALCTREGPGGMTPQSRLRRSAGSPRSATCTALYLMLHLKVHSVKKRGGPVRTPDRRARAAKGAARDRFESRSNQLQLAAWNRVDFGYVAPSAGQFLENERKLASFGSPARPARRRRSASPAASGEEAPDFPQLVSPLTGKPLDDALVEPERPERSDRCAATGCEGRRPASRSAP
jgi:hypothetical protein